MPESLSSMAVRHVRRSNTAPDPRLVQHRHHLIHVAFNNRIESGEKRIDGRPVGGHAGRTVGRSLILPAGCEMWGWTVGDVDFLGLELHPDALKAAADDLGSRRSGSQPPRPVRRSRAVAFGVRPAGRHGGGTSGRAPVPGRHPGFDLAPPRDCPPGRPRLSQASAGALSIVQFRRAREFLRENLHRDLRLAEMAGAVGLSTFHFARAFRAAAGTSPRRFLLEERLTTACRLLEGTAMTIGEIARSTGFQSLTGFGASFRRRWGVSPSDYRRSARG